MAAGNRKSLFPARLGLIGLYAVAVSLQLAPPSPSYSGEVKAPVLPLIRAHGESSGERLYLAVVQVGNIKTDIPLLLDSGSSTTSIDCKFLFAEQTCKSGRIRQKDAKKLGIRVTGNRIENRFESVIEESILAYAKLSFGAKDNSVSTETEVPFLIRLREVDRSSGVEITTGHRGVVGISPLDTSKRRADAVSAFRAINPGKGLRRGIILRAVGSDFQQCIDDLETCDREPLLQVGLGDQDGQGFQIAKAKRLAPRWPFATTDACLSFSGQKVCKATLIDTGSVKSIIAANGPDDADQLSDHEEMVVESKLLGTLSLKPDGERTIVFEPSLPFHVIGITLFMERSFLIDYERNMIGVSEGE